MAAAILLAVLACGGSEPVGELGFGPGGRARWIVEEPGEILDREGLYRTSTLAEWRLTEPQEVARWTKDRRATGFEPGPGGLRTAAEGRRQLLSRRVELSASEVHFVEVEMEDFRRGSLRLSWQLRDGTKGSLRRSALSGRGSERRRYRFEPGADAEWRGVVTRLILEVMKPAGDRPAVRGIAALGREVRPAELERAAGRAFKVELDHEVRNALLAPPGRRLERRLEGFRGGVLGLALGLDPGVRATVSFRVVVERPGTGPQVLLERRLTAAEERGRWHDVRLEIPAVRRGLLRLETVSDESFRPARGFPYWAHPEVVREVAEPGPSVLLISVDTLRADHLSLYGYPRPTSPHLDAWARHRAVVFRHAVAAAPWTLPSHYSLFTGLDAFRHGFNHDVGRIRHDAREGSAGGPDLLADILRRAGFATGAFTGGAYLHPTYGFAHGFDVYGYWPDRARAERELATGVDRALSWLEERRGEASFFFLHTYEVHDPYKARRRYFNRVAPPGVKARDGEIALASPPNDPAQGFRQINRFVWRHEGEKRVLTAADRPLIEAYYDSGIARMDAEIGRLLAGLEERGLADSVVVVLTSDHGEALGEGGTAGHVDLYDRNLLVPLVMTLPGGLGAGRTIDDQVRLIDLLPTLLEVLAVEPERAVDGVSLVDLVSGGEGPPDAAWSYSAAANRGVALRRGNRLKYILNDVPWPPIAGREELYDLEQDPAEERDRGLDDPRVGELRRQLAEAVEAAAPGLRLRVRNAGPGTLSAELRGPMVRPLGTKSVDLTCPCVRWKEMGVAELEVPPGETLTLRFGKFFGDRLDLSGALVDGERRLPFRHGFDVDRLETVAGLRLADSGWRPFSAAGEEVGTGFEIWWQGNGAGHGEAPVEVDPEIRRQLEALGYQ